MELNVGDIVEIVFNEPNDISEGKVVAEVEGHYIVKFGEHIHNFTLEGKNTSNSSVYIRKPTSTSEVSLTENMQVYSTRYGRGVVINCDTGDETYLVEFTDHGEYHAWYHKDGRRLVSGAEDMRVIPLPKCIEFVPGDIVEVWDDNGNPPLTTIFTTYVKDAEYPYGTINGVWKNCRKTNTTEYIKKMLEK